MDYLEIVIEELEREKQTLLSKQNKNLEKIKECEEKINYYTYLYNHFKQYSMHYGMLMESLNNVTNFSKRKKSFMEMPDLSLLFNGPSLDLLMEERYDDLKKKKTKFEKNKTKAEKCLGYYVSRHTKLCEENENIENRLIEIEASLEKKQTRKENKVLRKRYLEGGKQND